MAATVTGVQPLTPVQVPLETQPAPLLPIPTYEEGGNNGSAAGIPINNGKVPDSYYGIATPNGAGTGVLPTVVNATQGAAAQDDYAALNGTSSSGGKQSDLTKSYSSPAFPPPPQTVSTTAFGIPATGTNAPAPTYAGGTTYAMGAVVLATDGNAYQSIVASNVGHTPQSSPTKWNLMAPIALTQGPGGAWGAFANPALLPLWTSAAILQNAVVGYISVNATYRVAAAYASGTTYAAGTYVIATDNNVYFSLQAGNVGNDPTLTASAAFWQLTNTSFLTGTNYVVGQQTLVDGVLYVCVSAVTSNRPDVDSTDWGSGVTTVNPWLSSTTYAANAVVEYNNSVYISLQASNHDQIPGTQTGTTTGVTWWAELAVAPWNAYTNYLAGQYVTWTAATTGVTTLYLAQSGKNPVAQNPRVNNQLQIDSDTTQDNLPATVLWNAIGYGVIAPYVAIVGNTNHLPDANNQFVGTATWWKYLVGGNNIAQIAGDSQLAGAQIGYPPLKYGEGTEFTNWQMGSYFGPAAIDSPTSRTDFSTIVAKIVINLPASFAHTTTGYATVTITDNNGNLLIAGQRGIPPLVVSSATPANITATVVEGNTFLLTGVLAGSSVITASVGNTRSATATMTVS